MIKVIVTLIRYEDWVWSHPRPSLVRNYMIAGGPTFTKELRGISRLARNGWHTDPSPTEIDWVAVTKTAKPVPAIDGKPAQLGGHQAYASASANIVLDQKAGAYLSSGGRVVGTWRGAGKRAFAVILAQGTDGRWRIAAIERLDPPNGLGGLAR
jgi:hypothetical protein